MMNQTSSSGVSIRSAGISSSGTGVSGLLVVGNQSIIYPEDVRNITTSGDNYCLRLKNKDESGRLSYIVRAPSLPDLAQLFQNARLGAVIELDIPEFEADSLSFGDQAQDGSIYLGVVAENHIFMMDTDLLSKSGSRLKRVFSSAAKYIKGVEAHGHNDWVLPSKDIASKIYDSSSKRHIKRNLSKGLYWVTGGNRFDMSTKKLDQHSWTESTASIRGVRIVKN